MLCVNTAWCRRFPDQRIIRGRFRRGGLGVPHRRLERAIPEAMGRFELLGLIQGAPTRLEMTGSINA
jgi:hypothetical protein